MRRSASPIQLRRGRTTKSKKTGILTSRNLKSWGKADDDTESYFLKHCIESEWTSTCWIFLVTPEILQVARKERKLGIKTALLCYRRKDRSQDEKAWTSRGRRPWLCNTIPQTTSLRAAQPQVELATMLSARCKLFPLARSRQYIRSKT